MKVTDIEGITHYDPHLNSLGLCQCGCRECKTSLEQHCVCDDCCCGEEPSEDSERIHMWDL